MSQRLSRVFDRFRKDRSSQEENSPSSSKPSSSNASPIVSRMATFSTDATASTMATSTQSDSARSSRRTSQELKEKSGVVSSDSQASQLVREATGLHARAGNAKSEAQLLAECGVSQCSLAGYSDPKMMQLLQSIPEYARTGPSDLNMAGMYRNLQQQRSKTYLHYVDGQDPMMHRIKVDELMFEQFGDRPAEYAEDKLKEELENWRYTWHDEITILEQHDQSDRAAELRKAIEPYDNDLAPAIACVLKARDRRLRGSINLERFEQEARERREEIARNNARSKSTKSSAAKKSTNESPKLTR